MAIIRQIPWTEQPQEAAFASQWATSRGLRILVTADPQVDFFSGIFTAATITSGTRLIAPSPIGLAFSNSGASSVNSVGDLLLRNSWTVAIFATPVASSTQRSSIYRQVGTDSQQIGFNFDDQFAGGAGASGRFAVTLLDTGVNRSHAYVASAADGLPHAFVMRKSGTTVTAWIDGVSRTVTASGGFTGAPGSTTDAIRLYGDSGDGGNAIGNGSTVSGSAFFQQALTDTECAELSRLSSAWNLLFAPRVQRIWAPVAAGGGVTGSSSGSLDLAGSAAGAVALAGASSGTIALAGTAAGAAAIAAASTANLAITGTAAGAVVAAAASTASLTLTGTAAGAVAVAGASAGTLVLTGSATGTTTNAIVGASSATTTLTGTAAGVAPISGASTASISLLAASAGQILISGSSAGTLALSGSAAGTTGAAPLLGASVGTLELLASGAAQIIVRGTSAGTFALVATPASRIALAARTLLIAAEDRALLVRAEDRALLISAEDRTLRINPP